MKNDQSKTPRREFLGSIAAGAATLGISSLAPFGLAASPEMTAMADDADAWFEKVKGKHRVVFDVPEPHGIFPFAWPRVFIMTNTSTGTPENDLGVVIVLRHNGIPFAMEDKLWSKFKFGEVFKVNDEITKAPAVRNTFHNLKPEEMPVPGMSINDLQKSGVMFCVCDMALTVYSSVVAKNMNMDPAECKREWVAGLLPGFQPVPSGVWALGRAQEKKCAYIFAG